MRSLAAVGAHIGYIGAAAQIASPERRKRDAAGAAAAGAARRPAAAGWAGGPGAVGPGRRPLPIGDERDYSGGVLRKRRQRRARSAALVIGAAQVLIAAAVGAAQTAAGDGPSLEQLVRAAMARDVALEKLQLDLRNKQLAVAQGAAERGFGLSLTLESDPLVGALLTDIWKDEDREAKVSYGVSTGLTANLPHPFGSISTSASLSCTRPLADEGKCEKGGEIPQWNLNDAARIGLTSKVEQPLRPLLGLDATPAADLEAVHEVVQAERAVRARVRAITRDILNDMKEILGYRKAAREQEHELAEQEDEVTRRRDVLQDNQESHDFQTLLFNLEMKRRDMETTKRRLEQDLDAFEQRTGSRSFGLLTEARLALPADEVDRAPAVVDATVGLRVSEHRIREDENSRWPEVTVDASIHWPTPGRLSAGVGFNLILPILDGGLQQIKSERLNNGVEAAKLDVTSARREFAEALVAAGREIRDLDRRAWEHRERNRLAALKVMETKAALDAGVVVPSALAQAELEHELLALDGERLRVDRWLQKLALDALTDADLDFTPAP